MSSKRIVRVALLLCDTPVPAVLKETGDYLAVYTEWLQGSLKSYPDQDVANNTEVVVDGYDVVDAGDYPSESRLKSGGENAYDAVMLTGSKHTAYDKNNPFIPTLIDFVRKIGSESQFQHIKLVGICFGHQIISIAMGGECVAGTNGWEVGVYGNECTEEGKKWWGDISGEGRDDRVYVQQMHRDTVPAVPPGFHLCLKSEKYAVHSMVKYHPSSTEENPLAQIITIQGHPEFTPSIVSHVVDLREGSGLFDPEMAKEAKRRMIGKDGTGGEGLGRVGWAIWKIMLQDLPSA